MRSTSFIRILIIILIVNIAIGCVAKKSGYNKRGDDLIGLFNNNLANAVSQYKLMVKNVLPQRFPKTYYPGTGKFETSGSDWWCSGFYPGSLLYLYEFSSDSTLYKEAIKKLAELEKEKYNTGTHDLGFMMYCSFGNANRIHPQKPYDEILLQSAKSLSTRFNQKVGCIKSWNGKQDEFLVIIDNMMNLELLFWATQFTGDSTYYNIAVTHANTTIKNHFRPDYSSYHVINYNEKTGDVIEKRTAQGYADYSAWARGQAWGLYGFTSTFKATGDKKYLEQAINIANYILDHPNLPNDKIPYWDFNAPNIPNALRDASAASIMASALLELSDYVSRPLSKKYMNAAEAMLTTLSMPHYMATSNLGGFIIKHGVGHFPANSEIDVPLTYGDYYFIEAMLRYKKKQNLK